MYDTDSVPDHIKEELEQVAHKMGQALSLIIQDTPANLVIGALNYIHAATILHLVTEDEEELKKAALNCGVGIYRNLEWMLLQKGIIKEPWTKNEE